MNTQTHTSTHTNRHSTTYKSTQQRLHFDLMVNLVMGCTSLAACFLCARHLILIWLIQMSIYFFSLSLCNLMSFAGYCHPTPEIAIHTFGLLQRATRASTRGRGERRIVTAVVIVVAVHLSFLPILNETISCSIHRCANRARHHLHYILTLNRNEIASSK